MPNKIDSNIVGMSYAEEQSLKVLPGTPVWYPLDPNEYSDFGGEVTTVARNPINSSRQRQKGVVVDLNASGGFNIDLTQNNLLRLLQGFFFADARERITSIPISGAASVTTTVASIVAGATINVGTGKGVNYAIGHILKLSGFANTANNGICVVSAVSTDALTITGLTLVNETPSGDYKFEIVGYQFADGEAQISYTGGTGVLTLNKKTSTLPAALTFNAGEWIFVGGDTTATKFANNAPFYARIKSYTGTNTLTLEEASIVPVTEAGAAGKTVQIFFGTFLRNEKTTTLIKTRSYNLERTLGNDGSGIQAEYLVGALANELTMNVTSAEKLNVDLSFVALDNNGVSGSVGVKAGTRKTLLIEDAYNAANDIYRTRLFVLNPLQQTPASLFGYVMDGKISINNNVSGLKAIGVLGSFDITVGDFEVSGELNCYFTSTAAITAVKQNADCAFNMIGSKDNQGWVVDMPLLALGNGRLQVEKDKPIMLPLESNAAESSYGFTLGMTFFPYLPTVAMATVS